ncbi:uncharacterized protein LOC124297032 [Neodiprion virginianus]|uniref:uncharacterized protein LOC124297032 n=1 Tax=Neodiprion virginianus TaxID=2961670 RepID=UPI001EE72E84|nr:uncharacterized protein LOC124297032 [Neodiprion virginianus]
MLAFIFRGVFLVGIVSWYSTSVWKMIDGYFKDRFQSYLRAEYDKNPQMLADLQAYSAAAGKKSPALPTAVPPEPDVGEAVHICSAEVCPAASNKASNSMDPRDGFLGSEKQPETAAATEPPLMVERNQSRRANHAGEELKNDSTKMRKVKESRKPKRRSVEGGKPSKKRLKTITLTEKDFASTRVKVTPQDFDEFDADENVAKEIEDESHGVLVSKLPFKPKADIGDLRRVSEEEFCPLTLEDEVSCRETKTWP